MRDAQFPVEQVGDTGVEIDLDQDRHCEQGDDRRLAQDLLALKWTRAELADAAADLDLMLDGALEQINEAAFDAFDEPLCEGDDPVSVNTGLLEKIEA